MRGPERVEERVDVVTGEDGLGPGREKPQDHEFVEVRDVSEAPVHRVERTLDFSPELLGGETREDAFGSLAHVPVHQSHLSPGEPNVLLRESAVEVKLDEVIGSCQREDPGIRGRSRGAARFVEGGRARDRDGMGVNAMEPPVARLHRDRIRAGALACAARCRAQPVWARPRANASTY